MYLPATSNTAASSRWFRASRVPVLLFLALVVSLIAASTSVADSASGPGRYVALGDSFASGEGAYSYDAGTDTNANKCHRSAHAYARTLGDYASDPGALPRQTDFVACSGAITTNVVGDSDHRGTQWNEPLQIDRLGPDVKLVTISIGGNDVGFAPVLEKCVKNAAWDTACLDQDAEVTARIRDIGPRLTWVYQRIKRAAPNARVLVVGYPHLFPLGGHDGCNHLNRDDQNWMNDKTVQLDNVIRASAGAAGVEYVDMYGAVEGHEICGSSDPWVNDLMVHHASCSLQWLPCSPQSEPESFHPNRQGHQEFARRIDAQLEQRPAAGSGRSASGQPTPPVVYKVDGQPLGIHERSGPGTDYPVVGGLADHAAVRVSCQLRTGSAVGGSHIWDRLDDGTWVTDYFVDTPAVDDFTAGIPECR